MIMPVAIANTLRITARTLRTKRTALLIYGLSTLGTFTLYLSIFGTFRGQSDQYIKLFDTMPKWYFTAFKIDPVAMLQTVEGYLSGEMFGILWPVVAAFLLISFAGNTIAGEIEQRSLGLLLTLPVTRLQIVLGKYLAGLTALVSFIFMSNIAVMPIIAAYGYSYHPSHFWLLTVLTVLAGWAIYSFAFMLSCIFSERGKVYAISGGLLTLMYVINIFANVKDNLKNLQLSSFFYYYDPQAALVNGNVSTNAMIIFTAVAAVSTIVGVVWFLRRDIYL